MATTNLVNARYLQTSKLLLNYFFVACLTFLFLFGANFYFFGNGDIDNPNTPLFLSFSKDGIWIFCVLLLIIFKNTKSINKHLLMNAASVWIFCLGFTLFIFLKEGVLHDSYLKLFKNLFLYTSLTFVVMSILINRDNMHYFMNKITDALIFSMIISLLLFFFHPVQSLTGRLFGTYGNPNSAGLMGFASVAFFEATKGNYVKIYYKILFYCLALSVLIFAASLTAIISFAIFIICLPLIRSNTLRDFLRYVKKVALSFLVLIVILFNFFSSLLDWLILYTPIGIRFMSLADEGKDYESISIRLDDYNKMFSKSDFTEILQMDSTLSTYGFNFGVIGLIFLASIIIPAVRHAMRNIFLYSNASSFVSLRVLSLFLVIYSGIIFPTQFSFDVFPTNLLITIVICFVCLSKRLRIQKVES